MNNEVIGRKKKIFTFAVALFGALVLWMYAIGYDTEISTETYNGIVVEIMGVNTNGYTVADGSFLLKNGKNPLAAVAYRYYDRLFTQHTSREEQLAAGYDKYEKSLISKEHEKIATEYINKVCNKTLDDKLYALSNWVQGDGLSQQFWNSLTIDGKQPAQVVDSAKSQITKCLKETVGIANVK